MKTRLDRLVVFMFCTIAVSCTPKDVILKNNNCEIEFSTTKTRMPFIKNAQWQITSKHIFTGIESKQTELHSVFQNANIGRVNSGKWKKSESKTHVTATYSFKYNSVVFKRNYSLSIQHPILTSWLEIENKGEKQEINWYPILSENIVFSDDKGTLTYADALAFSPHKQKLADGFHKVIQSETYSSDHKGQLPSWRITGENTVCFDIEWCGGWQADFKQNHNVTELNVKLPPNETQLAISENEKIVGPKLSMTFIAETDERIVRQKYFQIKEDDAKNRYKMPKSGFPLIYNHWYAARRDISKEFILSQLSLMPSYGFDAFVLDDGWFDNLDNWNPDPKLFADSELENALATVKSDGITVGIWSAPWLLSGISSKTKNEIDPNGYYNKHMKAAAIDLYGTDFNARLYNHIDYISNDLSANWWKYDQEFLNDSTKHGKMKNIIALQEALDSVRKEFPELIIENCLSGGRMINDFTNSISQIHWIRDGSGSGLKHARSNIIEAMDAVNFLPLSKVQRWTNRVNEIMDEELLRFYCRSAMIGVWGISTDLTLMNSNQQKIIQQEIVRYREINLVKKANLYEIEKPLSGSPTAEITYYNTDADKAYVLVFRWDESEIISKNIIPSMLIEKNNYKLTNLDTNISSEIDGVTLSSKGFELTMNKNQLSTLFIIE